MITGLRLKRMCKVITSKMLIAAVIGATVLGTFGYAMADTEENTIKQINMETQSESLSGTIKTVENVR